MLVETFLLSKLAEIDELVTIRVMYGYMDGINDDLINEFKINKKLAHYFDIPIQHSETKILQAMNRRGDKEFLRSLFKKIRDKVPNAVLRTTVMVGFPGETDESFNHMIENLKKWRFDRLGCFTYSPEEGTAAYSMLDQIDEDVKQKRCEIVYETQRIISAELNKSRINSEVKVTIETISEDGIFYMGRSYGESPEGDPQVFVASQTGELEIGKTYSVRLVDSSDYELTGVTI